MCQPADIEPPGRRTRCECWARGLRVAGPDMGDHPCSQARDPAMAQV